MITRLEIGEVPPDRGFQVGDPANNRRCSHFLRGPSCRVHHHEACSGRTTEPQSVKNPTALACCSKCYVTNDQPFVLQTATEVPQTGQVVFAREGEQEPISDAGRQEASYRKQLWNPQSLEQAGHGD